MILELYSNIIIAKLKNGKFENQIVEIHRICFFSRKERVIKFKRIQFSLVLGFCQTIDKTQGQSFKNVV